MAAPVFVAEAHGSAGSGSSGTVNKPTGVESSMVLYMGVYLENAAKDVASSGWTLVGSKVVQSNGTAFQLAVLRRIAGGSEPSSYTYTWGGTSYWRVAGICAYKEAHPTVPTNASEGAASGSKSTTMRGPSIETTVPATRLLLIGANQAGSTYTDPSGFSNRTGIGNLYMADAEQAAAGASGNKDVTLGASAWNAAMLLAIAPIEEADTRRRMVI